MTLSRSLLFATCLLAISALADDTPVINYVALTPTFATAGQPTPAQLAALREQGLERVIYLAYSDHERSLPHEDRLVRELGMQFIQIPVEWDNPTAEDFALIAGVLENQTERATLLHCQMNYRASAFAMLYRVLYQDASVAVAKQEMNDVWTPNQVWTDFIVDTLSANGVEPNCEGCDWTPAKPAH